MMGWNHCAYGAVNRHSVTESTGLATYCSRSVSANTEFAALLRYCLRRQGSRDSMGVDIEFNHMLSARCLSPFTGASTFPKSVFSHDSRGAAGRSSSVKCSRVAMLLLPLVVLLSTSACTEDPAAASCSSEVSGD